MKKVVNGIVMEMTEEEIAAIKNDESIPEPTTDERLAILEAAMLELLGLSNADDLYHK